MICRCSALALALVLVATIMPAAAAAQARGQAQALSVLTEPRLVPDFDPKVRNYVTRCRPDGRVAVSVVAPRRSWVFVDGRWAPTSSTTTVRATEGQRFAVTVVGPGWRWSTYHVRCLPLDFPTYAAQRTGRTQAQWYVVAPFGGAPPPGTSTNYVAIFDNEGVPMWWYRAPYQPVDAKLLRDGSIGWLQYNETEALQGGADVYRLDGTKVRHVDTVGGGADHHELLRLRNGNYLIARYPRQSGVDLTSCGGPVSGVIYDNEVQEITPGGALVWSWKASDHLSPGDISVRWRDTCTVATPADIYHFNSVEPDRGGYVLSMRHLDAVLRIDRRTGRIDWKLGGTQSPESLVPIGDAETAAGGLGGQHDARILPDGTLTVHDNGTRAAHPTRAVRYRLDLRARTATLLEDVRDPDVPTTVCCGSARRLSGGNWVMAWGGGPIVTELTGAGAPVFRLTLGLFSYRADPISFGVLSPAALRRGMDVMHPRHGP